MYIKGVHMSNYYRISSRERFFELKSYLQFFHLIKYILNIYCFFRKAMIRLFSRTFHSEKLNNRTRGVNI